MVTQEPRTPGVILQLYRREIWNYKIKNSEHQIKRKGRQPVVSKHTLFATETCVQCWYFALTSVYKTYNADTLVSDHKFVVTDVLLSLHFAICVTGILPITIPQTVV